MPPLTILEEFMLLALDERAGAFWPVTRRAFDCATATAVLMDLMRLGRVDCDRHRLFVTANQPVDDDILDPVLSTLALDPVCATRAITDEIRFLADEGPHFRERAMRRLMERGVLQADERKILWVFDRQHYPVTEEPTTRLVKLGLLNVVLGETIPDPRDVALVGLVRVCDLFRHLLNPQELQMTMPRIDQIARMDILGRMLGEAVAVLDAAAIGASGLR